MDISINCERATNSGRKKKTKSTISISIDKIIKKDFIMFCRKNELKCGPIVEDLIVQYLAEIQWKSFRKKKKT